MKFVSIGQLCELKYGKSLRKDKRMAGDIPVYGANGIVGHHDQSLISGKTIIVGRKGSVGEVHYVEKPSWPIDTTYFIKLKKNFDVDLKWFFRLLKTLRLPELSRSAAIPGLNRNDVYKIKIPLPPLNDQIRIAHLLGKVEALITRRKHHLLQLDELLKSVFLEMFGDPVRNEKEWHECALGTRIKIKHGFAFKSEFFSEYGPFVLLTPGNFFEEGGFRNRG
ncbi:MAG: restriction endonuclease subunit S, partial [Desulfobacterales bacterium]|nr:restriction endonuclease subunit S [Desulfobacterales bacterium]